ncbi:MAG: 50S ribosomal protein L39e [Thermoproteota archaeon]
MKTPGVKLKLSRERRRAKATPTWIIAKTKLKVRYSRRRRNWKRASIKI